MKKNLLALTVAALAAATVASTASAATVYDKDGTSLAVYGRVQSVFYSQNATTHGVFSDNDYSETLDASGRFGLTMRQQFNSQFAGFANAEWDVTDGTGHSSFDARYLQVGVDMGQFGELKFGRFEEAIKYSLVATDIFDDWGCNGMQGNDDRRDGMVQYKWSGYGVDALISYQFPKASTHVDAAFWGSRNDYEAKDLDGSVSIAAGYTSPDILFGPISVRAGAAWGNFEDGAQFNSSNNSFSYSNYDAFYDKYTSVAASISWGKLNIGPYVAFQFSQRDFDVNARKLENANYVYSSDNLTATGFEFAAGYAFANGVSLRAGYNYLKYEAFNDEATANTLPVYANWQITPNFNVWAEARFNLSTDDDSNGGENFRVITNRATKYSADVYSVGIRYTF